MNEGDEPVPGQGIPGELGPESRLRRVPGIAWRVVEEEAILVNVRRDEVIHLDPVGSFIWSRMDGRAPLEEIAKALVEEFEVDLETAVDDILDFAGRLLRQGAAEVVELET